MQCVARVRQWQLILACLSSLVNSLQVAPSAPKEPFRMTGKGFHRPDVPSNQKCQTLDGRDNHPLVSSLYHQVTPKGGHITHTDTDRPRHLCWQTRVYSIVYTVYITPALQWQNGIIDNGTNLKKYVKKLKTDPHFSMAGSQPDSARL